MADFVQNSETKNAVRELRNPVLGLLVMWDRVLDYIGSSGKNDEY